MVFGLRGLAITHREASSGPVPRRVVGRNDYTYTCKFCGCVQVVPGQGAQAGEELRKGDQCPAVFNSFSIHLFPPEPGLITVSAGKLILCSCGEHGTLLLGSSVFPPPQRELGVPPPPTTSTYSYFAFITLVAISHLLICSHGKTTP